MDFFSYIKRESNIIEKYLHHLIADNIKFILQGRRGTEKVKTFEYITVGFNYKEFYEVNMCILIEECK